MIQENFNCADVKLDSTSLVDIYQAPNTLPTDRALVRSILVVNIDGAAAADITVVKTDASNNILVSYANALEVGVDQRVELVQNLKVLKAGQKIRAQASAAGDLDISVDVLELTTVA